MFCTTMRDAARIGEGDVAELEAVAESGGAPGWPSGDAAMVGCMSKKSNRSLRKTACSEMSLKPDRIFSM